MIRASMRRPRAVTTGVTVAAIQLYAGLNRPKKEVVQIATGSDGGFTANRAEVARLYSFLGEWLIATQPGGDR